MNKINETSDNFKQKLKYYSENGFVVTVFLRSGVKFFGTIKGYDGINDYILLENQKNSFEAQVKIREIHGIGASNPNEKQIVSDGFIDLDTDGTIKKNLKKLSKLKTSS